MKTLEKIAIASLLLLIISTAFNVYQYTINSQYQTELTKTIEVRLAYQVGFHYGQHIIMDHFDLIEKYSGGKAVATFLKISGGSTINEAIVAGSLEFGSMSAMAAIKGMDAEIPVKILASMGSKMHEVWTWREDIQSFADIKEGDIVNVVKVASIHHVGLIKMFAELGRSEEEVNKVVGFFSHANGYQLMEQREIDVHFAGVPYTTFYAENPAYHKIANDASIWGTPLPGSCIIGSTAFCEENPEIVAAVLSAWIEATTYIINNPREASRIIGSVYGYDETTSWETWQKSELLWNPTYGLTALEEVARIMFEIGSIKEAFNFEEMLFEQARGLAGI